jgi:hypothetical protein
VRLPAYLDERFTPPAPSIYSQIESKAIVGRQNLSFLIDTGASATTILDPDLKRLGIDWNSLTRFLDHSVVSVEQWRRASSTTGDFSLEPGPAKLLRRSSQYTLQNMTKTDWTNTVSNSSCNFPAYLEETSSKDTDSYMTNPANKSTSRNEPPSEQEHTFLKRKNA